MSDFTRREFIQNSMLLAAGMMVFSCEDSNSELKKDSPGMLSENRPPKQIIIVVLLSILSFIIIVSLSLLIYKMRLQS